MMAKRKFDKRDIQSVLKGFVDATYQEHGSHSFAAGYFESMLASILADSPRCKQVEAMNILRGQQIDLTAQRVIG
jgi:hypothetical protein